MPARAAAKDNIQGPGGLNLRRLNLERSVQSMCLVLHDYCAGEMLYRARCRRLTKSQPRSVPASLNSAKSRLLPASCGRMRIAWIYASFNDGFRPAIRSFFHSAKTSGLTGWDSMNFPLKKGISFYSGRSACRLIPDASSYSWPKRLVNGRFLHVHALQERWCMSYLRPPL